MKSVNLNFLEPSGPLQACNGTALPLEEISNRHDRLSFQCDIRTSLMLSSIAYRHFGDNQSFQSSSPRITPGALSYAVICGVVWAVIDSLANRVSGAKGWEDGEGLQSVCIKQTDIIERITCFFFE